MRTVPKKRIMRQTLVALAAMAISALPVASKPRTITYAVNCDLTWAAVKRATVRPHYNFALMLDAEKKGIVSTGSGLSGKRSLDIELSGNRDRCTIAIGGNFSGLVHDDKGDLTERIDQALREILLSLSAGEAEPQTGPPGDKYESVTLDIRHNEQPVDAGKAATIRFAVKDEKGKVVKAIFLVQAEAIWRIEEGREPAKVADVPGPAFFEQRVWNDGTGYELKLPTKGLMPGRYHLAFRLAGQNRLARFRIK